MLSDLKATPRLPAVFGCAGLRLTKDEQRFFEETAPVGFILFARNCQTPDQVRALVEALTATVEHRPVPVTIDQEGGRVSRLKPPHWRHPPPADVFGRLAQHDLEGAREAVRLNARLIAAELIELGITMNCAPLLDVPAPGGHDIIGDRAFATDPERVADLGRAQAEGFLDGGVLPIIKHIPGHGRAGADSHLALPMVEADLAELSATDFEPFRALSDMPWAMTAHVLYTALDADRPATTSPTVIGEIVRKELGFEGVLVSDDLSMEALSGDLRARTEAALGAGCDVALHCNGDRAEMEQVAEGAGALSAAAQARLERAAAFWRQPDPFDAASALARLDTLLAHG